MAKRHKPDRYYEEKFDALKEEGRLRRPVQLVDHGKCDVCDTPLGIPNGMAETGLCGPCCTGEAETLEEFGDTW